MSAARIFKSDEARDRLTGWYDRFLRKVAGPVERREVPTSLGPSHVLLAGAPAAPPLVCLHGSLAGSAHLASELGPLLKRFRLIAPDLPGQSARGPLARLSYADDSLPRWVLDVADGLGVDRFNLLGVSLGGFAARLTAAHDPARVETLVLIVPAGVVGGSVWKGLTRMAVPIALYKLIPSERRLKEMMAGFFTTWDDDWAHYMGDAMRDFVLDLRVPPLATDAQLRSLAMPTLVVAGDDDVSFPGDRLVKRVRATVPRVETELVAGCKHGPPTTPEFRAWLADRVTRFVATGPGVPA